MLYQKLTQQIITLLQCVNWETLKRIDGTDCKYAKFHSILLDIVNKVVPVTSIRPKRDKKVNDNLTRELIEQVKLFVLYLGVLVYLVSI
jgi:hypothetical protein